MMIEIDDIKSVAMDFGGISDSFNYIFSVAMSRAISTFNGCNTYLISSAFRKMCTICIQFLVLTALSNPVLFYTMVSSMHSTLAYYFAST